MQMKKYKLEEIAEINSSNSPKIQRKGYANFKCAELFEKLKTSLGKVKNKQTGIEEVLSKKSLEKMTSAKAIEKSKQNGYSLGNHFLVVRMYTTSPTRFAKKGNILMSVRAPVGTMNIVNTNCCDSHGK